MNGSSPPRMPVEYVVSTLSGRTDVARLSTYAEAVNEAVRRVDAGCSIVSVLRFDDGPIFGRHFIRSTGEIRITSWALLSADPVDPGLPAPTGKKSKQK